MSIISNAFYNSLPSFPRLQLDSPKNIARKLNRVAVPAILLLGAQSIQGSDAFLSCITCAVCVASALGLPVIAPGCFIPCTICGVQIPGKLDAPEIRQYPN